MPSDGAGTRILAPTAVRRDIVEVESTIEIAPQSVSDLVTSCDGETVDLVLRALVCVRATRNALLRPRT